MRSKHAPPHEFRNRSGRRSPRLWISLALFAVTAAVYAQVLGFDFVAWDDYAYVRDNPHVREGLSPAAVRWALTSVHGGHWHPLTSLSHIADCELYGLNPLGHHLTNLLLHGLNAVLVFAVFDAATGAVWPSALVAALFALHPLHVESVAWISDRKDLLSACFGLLSLAAYIAYAKRPRRSAYLLALLCFALALAAKATMVTLPILFLLLDWWPLRRLADWRRAAWEKLPFLALAAAFGAVAVVVVRGLPESGEHGSAVAMSDRIANAVVSYGLYVGKTLWPSGLSILYPHPNLPGGTPWTRGQVACAALVLLGITAAVAAARARRYLAVGWLWFLLTLFPIIGLMQIGPQAMADRYSYLPLIGLFVMGVWGCADWIETRRRRAPIAKRAAVAVSALVLAACAAGTYAQTRAWRDSETLFRRALQVAPRSPVLHTDLAVMLRGAGKLDEAIEHYRAALAVQDDIPETHFNFGNALASHRDIDEAIEHYRRAVELDPRFVMAHYNLGGALRSQGRLPEAAESYRHALEIRPDFYQASSDLGIVLHSMGQLDAAVDAYRGSLRIHASAPTYRNLAKALAGQGRMEEANEALRRAATAPAK